ANQCRAVGGSIGFVGGGAARCSQWSRRVRGGGAGRAASEWYDRQQSGGSGAGAGLCGSAACVGGRQLRRTGLIRLVPRADFAWRGAALRTADGGWSGPQRGQRIVRDGPHPQPLSLMERGAKSTSCK